MYFLILRILLKMRFKHNSKEPYEMALKESSSYSKSLFF
jgi:hypothetical protein